MTEQDYMIGYIYSLFGRTISNVQIIEKGIMNIIVLDKLEIKISNTRYYELLFEYNEKTTGQLLRDFNKLIPPIDIEIFENFHKLRDFLSHQYWWEINIELVDKNSIDETIIDLNNYISNLEKIIKYLNDFQVTFEERNNLVVNEKLNRALFFTSLKEIKKFRKLNKNETVIEVFIFRQSNNEIIPIFKLLDESHWTISESGLSQYFEKISSSRKISINELNGIFPIKQFNPRPKINSPWNYELLLKKKGLKMIIKRTSNNKPFEWKIE